MSTIRIMLHANAWTRNAAALAATGLPLEAYVPDAEGRIVRATDGRSAEAGFVPDVLWFGMDAMIHDYALFARTALGTPPPRWVHVATAGLDLPGLADIAPGGARVSNNDAAAVSVAEFALAQVLAEWHPIARQRAAQARCEWAPQAFRELSQSRWLVIGYGNIGREIARRASAFGAAVTGVARTAREDPFCEAVIAASDIAGHLAGADIVVLACPLTDGTRDMVDTAFLAQMKPGSLLVNVGRGGLIDEDALLAALDAGRPRLFITDVVRQEPLLPDSLLWRHPAIRLTPHEAGGGSGTEARSDRRFIDNLARFAAGERLTGEVVGAL